MEVLTTYNCDALTGGGSRALDSISVYGLVDGCRAFAVIDGAFIPFVFDADATDAQDIANRPYKVRPIDYTSAGVWIEQAVLTPGGFKNRIINGNFDIWQRGTSFNLSGTSIYTADRWMFGSTTGTQVLERETLTDADKILMGNVTYSMKITQDAESATGLLDQRIEVDRMSLNGKVYTLSFWAKSDIEGTIINYVDLYGANHLTSGPITLSTTWQKFTHTFPAISGETSANVIRLRFRLPDGETDTFHFAKVQLEEGAVATPFEQRQVGVELALCQRYFEKSYNMAIVPGTALEYRGMVYAYKLVASISIIEKTPLFSVQKRIPPTITIYSPYTGNPGYIYSFSDAADRSVISVSDVGERGVKAVVMNASIPVGYTIGYHWTADAEL